MSRRLVLRDSFPHWPLTSQFHARVIPIMLFLLLASCATPPPKVPAMDPMPPAQPAPAPEALPVLSIREIKAAAVDQHRSILTLTAGLQNPRSTAVVLLRPTLQTVVQTTLQPEIGRAHV